MFLYNIVLRLTHLSFRLVWACKPIRRHMKNHHPKTFQFVMGQRTLLPAILHEMEGNVKDVYWFHAASAGEYNAIRPIIRKIDRRKTCVVVTLFSPSGYESLTNKNRKGEEADHIFYLPLDTPSATRRFLDTIRPSKAIFAISEYWINYLHELEKRHIPTFWVSMLVNDKSYLLKWYARPIRKALHAVRTFMVLDTITKDNLKKMGFNNTVVIGDPLLDNAINISKEAYRNLVVEKFAMAKTGVFVAGSISDKKDLRLVAALANAHRDVKFIVVPHEISEESLNKVVYEMEGKTLLFSECDANTDFTDTQVLVIDFLGSLSRIYRYGTWAYVGGGFTPYLHSVIEPMVYGIPISFGPRIERKNTPRQMIDLGVGCIVRNTRDIKSWFESVKSKERLEAIREKSEAFALKNSHATDKAVQIISA